MITLIIFLLVLSVLIFVHEFGHFVTAKRAGLRVDEFGFGFPPRIFGIQKVNGKRRIIWGNPKNFNPREGETLYSLNALPFGGFVKIKGEAGEDDKDQDSFASRGALRRAWVIAAGVIMNALFAVLLIAIGYSIGFPQALTGDLSKFARIKDQHIEVVGVLSGAPADQAGIVPGDRLVSGNGREFKNAQEFTGFVTEFLGKEVKIVVGSREVEITPVIIKETGHPGIGVGILDIAVVKYPVWIAIPKSFELAGNLMKEILFAFGGIIRDAVLGKPISADVAGPVGIAVLTGQAARQGFIQLLQFVVILSLNLAIINILPFPALDGGRILFILIEKLRGRKVSQKIEGWMHTIGFGLLLLLVLFITYRDVAKYWSRIWGFLFNLIR